MHTSIYYVLSLYVGVVQYLFYYYYVVLMNAFNVYGHNFPLY